MKKNLLLLFFSFWFLNYQGQAQGIDWSFNLKTNFSIEGINKTLFPTNNSNDFFKNENSGWGFGIQGNYKISKNFSFISGLEGNIMNHKTGILENSNPIATNDLGDFTLVDESFKSNLELEMSDPINNLSLVQMETEAGYLDQTWNQNLLYMKVPLNFGYSIKSKKMTAYGGLWYARLFQSDYEGFSSSLFRSNSLYNKDLLGANAGIELGLLKGVSALVDITHNFNGVNSSNSPFIGYSPVVEQVSGIPGGRGSRLVSLGLNFKLK